LIRTRRYCPQVKLVVRAFAREHALELVKHDADYIVRETFEAALRGMLSEYHWSRVRFSRFNCAPE